MQSLSRSPGGRLVQDRDRRCRFPECRVPARSARSDEPEPRASGAGLDDRLDRHGDRRRSLSSAARRRGRCTRRPRSRRRTRRRAGGNRRGIHQRHLHRDHRWRRRRRLAPPPPYASLLHGGVFLLSVWRPRPYWDGEGTATFFNSEIQQPLGHPPPRCHGHKTDRSPSRCSARTVSAPVSSTSPRSTPASRVYPSGDSRITRAARRGTAGGDDDPPRLTRGKLCRHGQERPAFL